MGTCQINCIIAGLQNFLTKSIVELNMNTKSTLWYFIDCGIDVFVRLLRFSMMGDIQDIKANPDGPHSYR